MASRKPTPQTIAFGAELHRRRETAGLSRLELAKLISISRSYIGQVETGVTRCREEFAQCADNALGCAPALEDAWNDLLRSSGYPKWFADYPQAESTAALLRAFSATYVDGLLQREDYARVLLASDQTGLEGRLRRQQILTRENPPRLVVVLEESVLARQVGSREVMHAQCEYLLEVSQAENITLQIASTMYHRGVSSAFNIATQPNGEELVHQETSTGGVTSNDVGDILHLVSAFAELQARSLSVSDSREFLRKAVVRWSP
ncbi:helix-turn-helix domain-containing protein [Actinomadura rugatobispora]|uniref:Helix-turn-helix domain-containing protein n=1 Tax=Actinomadura rugatobispora TaxID=1994 RepID=A0ABW1A328_9ACTN|nr:helix-turn-helix transcriptional regulator [Actinomadura rugatobispora]